MVHGRPGVRRGLLLSFAGLAVLGAVSMLVLVLCSSTQVGVRADGQVGVVPHLVPDAGAVPSESQGTTSAPRIKTHGVIEPIPSAGGPVYVYGGAPSGASSGPTRKTGEPRNG